MVLENILCLHLIRSSIGGKNLYFTVDSYSHLVSVAIGISIRGKNVSFTVDSYSHLVSVAIGMFNCVVNIEGMKAKDKKLGQHILCPFNGLYLQMDGFEISHV